MLRMTIYGTPQGKAALTCMGGPGGRHRLVASNRAVLKPWQEKVQAAAAKAAKNGQVEGAVGVYCTFTVPRPISVKAPLPIKRSKQDIDHYVRAILDGLTAGGVIADDSQVVQQEAITVYPDTPMLVDEDGNPVGRAGRLSEPGVVIYLYRVYAVCGECSGAGGEDAQASDSRATFLVCGSCEGSGLQ